MSIESAIPRRFPAEPFDCAAADIARWGDMVFNLELVFDERLDAGRVARALALALDAEPVLGCRFVRHWWQPYWERVGGADTQTLQLAGGGDEYERFKLELLDFYKGPQVRACLWQAPEADRLALKISHLACDAGGAKDVARAISSIYTRLGSEPGYEPPPNLKGSRGMWQVMRTVPRRIYPHLWRNYYRMDRAGRQPPHTHRLVLEEAPEGPYTFVVRHLAGERVARLTEYRRRFDATLNDLMLAAFFRASAVVGEWDGRRQLRVHTTVDFRRYLPGGRAEAVAFLSAAYFGWPSLGTDLGRDFDATLGRVAAITRKAKADYLGLDQLLMTWIFIRPPYARLGWILEHDFQQRSKKGNTADALTNMGPIDPASVSFGTAPVSAWLLVPPARSPYFAVGISGYRGSLTLSAGVHPANVGIAERFLDAMIAELPA